ncbi:MAG: AimR family lysis-lysogeny pheromone receptor [Bacillota bacterium]
MIAHMIEERIDTLDTHITWSYISKKLKLDRSTLSKFKNEGKELGFQSLLELCEILYPQNYNNVMCNWCLFFRRPGNVKLAFEFLSINRDLDGLERYINIFKSTPSTSVLVNELTDVYTHILAHQRNLELPSLESISYKKAESSFLLSICKLYKFHKSNDIAAMRRMISETKEKLREIDDKALYNRYDLRISEIESTISLFVDCDTLKTRILCEKILKDSKNYCDKFVGDSYYRMGMSYLYESPDMCLAFLQKAVSKLDASGLFARSTSIKENEINLARIIWGLCSEKDIPKDKPSKAHYFAKLGKSEEANAVIKELPQESAFTKYYNGLANNNANKLIESALTFKDKGQMFYANLPLVLLEQFEGMSEIVRLIKKSGEM